MPAAVAGEHGRGPLGRHADAVVAHAQHDVLAGVAPGDRDVPVAAALDAVADRVLDQRLQRQHRHDDLQHLGRDLDPHRELVAEAGALEPQVPLHVVELVGERHVGVLAAERVARELGEVAEELARLLRRGVDVSRHRRERVVDEVGRDLRPQRAQLGARKALALGLELGELDLRRHQARRLLDRARVLRGQASPAREEGHERPRARAPDDQRRDDRRAEGAAGGVARDR